MSNGPRERAVELLKALGLKTYEAECFVALTRIPRGTAKDISDIADVPRTRVYDATDALEGRGLIEVQRSNPQQFRAIPLSEAIRTLEDQYERQIEELHDALAELEPTSPLATEQIQEVWSLTGRESIVARIGELIEEAEREIALVVGERDLSEDELVDRLVAAADEGCSVLVGVLRPSDGEAVRDRLPDATVFESGLDWLRSSDDEPVSVGRLLLVDRETLLLTSVDERVEPPEETAICAEGAENGLVVVARLLLDRGVDRLA